MTQHGDRIIPWLAAGGGALFLAVIAAFAVAFLWERRAERLREAEAAATLLPAASSVDERTVEEIAADGLTAEQRADAERDKRIAAWDGVADYFRNRDLATMDRYTVPLDGICERLKRDMLTAYDDGALAAEGFGFPIQAARARMAALYERAHDADELRELAARPLAVTVDASDTREWTAADVAELNAWLDAGQASLDAERAEAVA